MNKRSDISNYLVHFTKGNSEYEAFENLRSIIKSYSLIGNNGMIKGGHKCVCFSEAPLSAIKDGLVNSDFYSKYSPFGIMLSKKWLFEQGGRPVIYQREEEYKLLNENSWRHVTYEPDKKEPIDFTWEREWRIKTDKLLIGEDMCTIVLPNEDWANDLVNSFEWDKDKLAQQYDLIYDDPLMAEVMASNHSFQFMWPMVLLNKEN